MKKPNRAAYAYIGDGEYVWFDNYMADNGRFIVVNEIGLTIRKQGFWRTFHVKPIDFTDSLPQLLQSILK